MEESIQCRLIYRSTAKEEFISNEDLRSLVEKSAANNANTGITGMLLYTGREFLQVLEGPEPAVNELFQKISKDDRHQAIRLLTFETIGPAYFEEWSMRLVDLYDVAGPVREMLMEKYRHADGVIHIPDRLNEVLSLLLDARAVSSGEPWTA